MRQCKGCGAGFYRGEERCLYCGMSLTSGGEESFERERDPWEEEKESTWDFSVFKDAFARKKESRKHRADDFRFQGRDYAFRQEGPPPIEIFQREKRRNIISAVLAFTLGTFGVHWFYRGRITRGILYFVFSWSGIPTIVGLVEGIGFLRRGLSGSELLP